MTGVYTQLVHNHNSIIVHDTNTTKYFEIHAAKCCWRDVGVEDVPVTEIIAS
jgi:hypothetical protein